MSLFTHVLCPVDFSETSHHALEHAGALAASYGARLTVMHVLPPGGEVPMAAATADSVVTLPPPTPEQVRGELTSEVQGLEVVPATSTAIVDVGRPHAAVLARIEELGVDLLVVGTHGRSGFQRLVLGSVTEKLLRTAPCPVLTVPPSAAAHAPAAYRHVLCPTDFSSSARRALTVACDLATRAGGQVTLLHAVEDIEPEVPGAAVFVQAQDYRERVQARHRQQLHAEIEEASPAGCAVVEAFVVNRAYREILDRAAALPADVIVMGFHGHSPLELMFFGSTTQHVVRQAPCPVLTVRA